MNRRIRIAILEAGFDLQCDFAEAVRMSTPFVSNILKGRKKLSKQQAEAWQAVLQCRPCVLKNVTK